MMASPNWKPLQTPNNHENATSATFGRFSSSSYSPPISSPNRASKPVGIHQASSYQANTFDNNAASNELSSSPGASSAGFREAGIVEKLCPSYGFIQCCERQARLFFHYSQFNGNIEHLKLGDPVEFEMTYDRRTGKPIASFVVKICSEAALIGEELSSDPVTGFITIEVTVEKEGRVAYENRGECFFLPFTKEDIVDEIVLSAKDRVKFHISTDKTGNLRARHIILESPTPQRFEGVICTLKESFGFIERADIVKEIFFHSSECDEFKDLTLGDDVQFSVQTRNGKEVAVNVTQLSPGTVVFEDVSPSKQTGQITKTIERSASHTYLRQHPNGNINSSGTEPFPGKIRYKTENIDVEMPFGERDIKGEFTLKIGDWVKFNIVTDRRDKLKHATNIDLYDESFTMSGEIREQGYIAALKDSYGFIKCINREGSRIYFKLAEMLDPNLPVKLNDEVEFTIAPDMSSPGRLQAIRIKELPNGTIFKNLISPKQQESPNNAQNDIQTNVTAFQAPLLAQQKHLFNGYADDNNGTNDFSCLNQHNALQYDYPLIDLETDSCSNTTGKENYRSTQVSERKLNTWSNILSQLPINLNTIGDPSTDEMSQLDLLTSVDGDPSSIMVPDGNKFERNGYSIKSNDDRNFENVQSNFSSRNGYKHSQRGFIAALKDSYGFIESEDHQTEVFFHFSVYDGNVQQLDLSHEVEYAATMKNGKLSAEYVHKIQRGTIEVEEVQQDTYNGKVTRSVRCLNPEQEQYCGIVEVTDSVEEHEKQAYEFSMTSLADIHEYIQKGDVITFQIGILLGEKRAVNIKPVRTKHQATVEAVKGNFGFLNFDVDDGKKLFFHMSEVKGDEILHAGDFVEFVVVHNQRSGKYSACSVLKKGEQISKRPERLMTRKNFATEEALGPRIVLIRQPKGPDGSKGFTIPHNAY